MTILSSIMISFFLVCVSPSLPDTVATDSAAVRVPEARQVHRTLTTDEFIMIYVSLTRILDDCAGDRDLFVQKRDRYLSGMGVTREQLYDFVTSEDRTPDFWSSLWQTINDRLQPPDSLTTESGE